MPDSLLEINGLTKTYPGVVANSDVHMNIRPGEVHALLGENGAGKSTLVKMIYGLVKPDSGEMLLNGERYKPADPRAARGAGIAMVFQHFSLFDSLDVAQNIALGMENPPAMKDLSFKIEEVSRRFGLPINPHRIVGDLSAGERQRVEIIRCLLQNPDLLIMDEPTSVLTPQEVEVLFGTLRTLAENNTSILYISHKLEEVRSLCTSATILRHGEVVGTCDPRETSAAELAEKMVGATLHVPEKPEAALGDVRLVVNALSHTPKDPFGTKLQSISFDLRAGEVLGIGGVAGNGQEELVAALSGEARTRAGTITLNGRDISQATPNERRVAGLSTAPEERNGHAAVGDMSLIENALLTARARMKLARNGFVKWKQTGKFASEIVEVFDVRTPSTHTAAGALSGGNLQKFVIGREILQQPDVLVVNQPTWGVDAAAAAAIRQAILDLADEGSAVVVISQDLDELIEISDRFAALNAGALSAPEPMQGLTLNDIGLMLGGANAKGNSKEAAHVGA